MTGVQTCALPILIEYVQNSIQENLDGVTVKPTPVPFSVRLDRSTSGDFDAVLGDRKSVV
nr:hypothetical protein [Enterococcus faecium]